MLTTAGAPDGPGEEAIAFAALLGLLLAGGAGLPSHYDNDAGAAAVDVYGNLPSLPKRLTFTSDLTMSIDDVDGRWGRTTILSTRRAIP